MGRRFLLRGEHVKAPEDHASSPVSIPGCQLVGSGRKRQVDGEAYDLRKGYPRRRPLQQVLVPVPDLPLWWGRSGDTRERQRGREDVLTEAGVRILGVERIDQQRRSGMRWPGLKKRVEPRRDTHLLGNPKRLHGCLIKMFCVIRGKFRPLTWNNSLRYRALP